MQISAASGGLASTGMRILRTEGLRAFYVSYPTTLMMSIPYQSIQFATYEYMRSTLNPSGKYDPTSHIIAGGVAGAVASTITNPLDVAKTLLQTRGLASDSALRQASSLSDAFKIIYARSGFAGFARGVGARVLANAPSTAICWTTYEFLKVVISSPSTDDSAVTAKL
nr:Fe(2+) transporter [Polyrhizophydium stewartii]